MVIENVRRERRKRAGRVAPSRLGQVLEGQSPRLQELADRLQWPLSKLSKLKHGRQTPDLADLRDIAMALRMPLSELLDPEDVAPGHAPVVSIPLVPVELLGSLTTEGLLSLGRTWGGPTMLAQPSSVNAVAINLPGKCMDRILSDSAKVVIDFEQREPVHGQTFLIVVDNGTPTLREYRDDNGVPRWIAHSLERIDDIFMAAGPPVRVIGRAVSAVTAL